MQTIINLNLATDSWDLFAKQTDTDWTLIGTYETWDEAEVIRTEMIKVDEEVKKEGLQVN